MLGGDNRLDGGDKHSCVGDNMLHAGDKHSCVGDNILRGGDNLVAVSHIIGVL